MLYIENKEKNIIYFIYKVAIYVTYDIMDRILLNTSKLLFILIISYKLKYQKIRETNVLDFSPSFTCRNELYWMTHL